MGKEMFGEVGPVDRAFAQVSVLACSMTWIHMEWISGVDTDMCISMNCSSMRPLLCQCFKSSTRLTSGVDNRARVHEIVRRVPLETR